MNFTLPKTLWEWVELQVKSGVCASVDDYIVALICRDMADKLLLQNFQDAIRAGMASGISERCIDDVVREARALALRELRL